ncbi:TPA: hypothetical protein ACSP2U_004240, partial [Aeromonas veronii]
RDSTRPTFSSDHAIIFIHLLSIGYNQNNQTPRFTHAKSCANQNYWWLMIANEVDKTRRCAIFCTKKRLSLLQRTLASIPIANGYIATRI